MASKGDGLRSDLAEIRAAFTLVFGQNPVERREHLLCVARLSFDCPAIGGVPSVGGAFGPL